VLRSGRWSGWHRYVPLLTGTWVVIVITPAIVLAGDPGTDGAGVTLAVIGAWHLLWMALGVAVLAETRTAQRMPA
jgi:hypothetical protein